MDPNQNQNSDPNQPQQPGYQPEYLNPSVRPVVQPTLPNEPSAINITDIPSNASGDELRPIPKQSKALSSAKGFLSVIELVGGALLLALVINSFVFQSYQVFGQSMEPTLQQGNRLIVSKFGKSISNLFNNDFIPSRDTVIVFENPRNPEIQLVKRIVGLPGERIVVRDGTITVFNDENPNGFDPDEARKDILPEFTTGNVDVSVPEGHVFVSGDNRAPGGSLDSRNDLGTVPIDKIIGTISMRIFPLSDAEFF